jgi:hypothetical protein
MFKVFGVIEYFMGRFFYQGLEGRLNSDACIAFLTRVLKHTTQPIILKLALSNRQHGLSSANCQRIHQTITPLRSSGRRSNSKIRKDTHLHYLPDF